MQPSDVRQVYASGTAYSLTNTSAAVDFGTTDPSLTITQPGTYLIFSRLNLKYTGATFAASRTVTLKLRRTNNTAADVTNASITFLTDIITTLTYTAGVMCIPPVLYQTDNNNDVLSLFADVSVVPTAGSLDITESEIIAIRLF